jgi:hypothetical protein
MKWTFTASFPRAKMSAQSGAMERTARELVELVGGSLR